MDTPIAPTEVTNDHTGKPPPPFNPQDVALRFMAATGVLFIIMSIVSIGALVWLLVLGRRYSFAFSPASLEPAKTLTSDDRIIELLTSYIPAGVLFIAAIFCAGFGYVLLRAAGAARREVIPREDAELLGEMLRGKNQEGVDNYVKLSGLSGAVGLFTKLGLYGLPLATIILTVFFAIVGLFQTNGTQMLDLAKLTLGAFIGSFVQRTRNEGPASKRAT